MTGDGDTVPPRCRSCVDGHKSLQECRVGTTESCSRTGLICIPDDYCKNHGCYCKIVTDKQLFCGMLLLSAKCPRPPGRLENTTLKTIGESLKGPTIPFGAMGSIFSYFCERSRVHQFGNNVLPSFFPGYELIAGGFWKGDLLIADYKIWKFWTHQKFVTLERINA